jgi:hypothetical protein
MFVDIEFWSKGYEADQIYNTSYCIDDFGNLVRIDSYWKWKHLVLYFFLGDEE